MSRAHQCWLLPQRPDHDDWQYNHTNHLDRSAAAAARRFRSVIDNLPPSIHLI
ncbi:MAG: hypothetical protein IPM55_00920 [Acidobacteria bacterium]|nr:hypothetical protein [Acidobacteriota bacterium]